jgi:hypothetical protein
MLELKGNAPAAAQRKVCVRGMDEKGSTSSCALGIVWRKEVTEGIAGNRKIEE